MSPTAAILGFLLTLWRHRRRAVQTMPYRLRDLLEQILADHTGQSIERIHADTDRDFVMEANEALEYGIIDDVISSRQLADRTGPIR